MKRVSSLFQKLCRMDFLVVWDSQVPSPPLWLLQAGGPWLPHFLQSFLSSLSGALSGGVEWARDQHSLWVKSLWIPSQCYEADVPPSCSLMSCAPGWPRAAGPEPWTCPVLEVLSIAVLHHTWLSHHHTPQQKELRAALPGWWIEAVHRTCHPVSSLHTDCFTPCDASLYWVCGVYTCWSVSPS